jgi:CheY-like chemotaxis protein
LEDNNIDSELIHLQLKAQGVETQVMRVTSRADFYRALVETNFDVIFSDSNLPSFNGFSALELASNFAARTPFVFVSGHMSKEDTEQALKDGAIACVQKGDTKALVDVLHKSASDQPR